MLVLEITLMNLILQTLKGDEMEGESGVYRSILDELHSWDIQGDQMEGQSSVTRSILDELQSSNI